MIGRPLATRPALPGSVSCRVQHIWITNISLWKLSSNTYQFCPLAITIMYAPMWQPCTCYLLKHNYEEMINITYIIICVMCDMTTRTQTRGVMLKTCVKSMVLTYPSAISQRSNYCEPRYRTFNINVLLYIVFRLLLIFSIALFPWGPSLVYEGFIYFKRLFTNSRRLAGHLKWKPNLY